MKGIIIDFLYRKVGFSMNLGIANTILQNFYNTVKISMPNVKAFLWANPTYGANSSKIHKIHSFYKRLDNGFLLTNSKIIKVYGLFPHLRQQRYIDTINYFLFRRKLISNF